MPTAEVILATWFTRASDKGVVLITGAGRAPPLSVCVFSHFREICGHYGRHPTSILWPLFPPPPLQPAAPTSGLKCTFSDENRCARVYRSSLTEPIRSRGAFLIFGVAMGIG